MSKTILEVRDLVVKYGEITALKGISLDVIEGKITTLIGSNGAGKTTLLNSISGILKPAAGTVSLMGKAISGMSADKIVKAGITHCPEGRKIFPRQTVYENLKAGAFTIKNSTQIKEDVEKMFNIFPRLKERRDQKAGTLSGGEQQMLAICRALMSHPKLLMLDEPSMGLSPKLVEEVFKTIKQINEDGTTILLVEQNANQALKIADKGYVLEVGKIAYEEDADSLLHNDVVRNVYLGIK